MLSSRLRIDLLFLVFLLSVSPKPCSAGTFASRVDYRTGRNGAWSIAVGDFNNDGYPDLVSGDLINNTVSMLLNNGDGTFQTHQEFPAGYIPSAIAVGDFNRDGNLDVVVADGGDTIGNLAVLLGNGDGTFQPYVTYPTGLASSGMQ